MTAEPAVRHEPLEASLALVTLNRPERLNAIDDTFIEAFHHVLDELETDADLRAVVLTGAGRGFCAGGDLKATATLAAQTSATVYRLQQQVSLLSVRLHEFPVPVVAAVNGPAAGGGFALAAACDLRVVASSAHFSAANIKIGISGGEMGLSWLLPQTLGRARATELLLSGRRLSAAEALEWGFAAQVVSDDDVVAVATELARTIAANPAFGVRLTKEMLRSTATASTLREAILLENRTQVLAVYSGDIDKAMSEFRRAGA